MFRWFDHYHYQITNVKFSTTAVIHLYNVDEELSQYSKMKCNFKAFLKTLLDLIL